MNTIFIIGNGFDLAHGLQTRYEDFILTLLKRDLNKLVEIYHTSPNYLFNLKETNIELGQNHTSQIVEYIRTKVINFKTISELKNKVGKGKHIVKLTFKNVILQRIWDSLQSSNWSDIEWQYFKLLSEILIPEKGSPSIDQTPHLDRKLILLNQGIDDISLQFSEYLTNVIDKFKTDFDLIKRFNEILIKHSGVNNMILNFNYTSTVMHCPVANSYETIPIHGVLGQSQPLIIGYGDETTELYKEMENRNNFNYLKHTKSSRYAENDNYIKVHSFINDFTPGTIEKPASINGDEYEIVVLGHSCGLSDRVLLKELMEKPNCNKIHVYYYDDKNGNNDFLRTVSNISRHFEDKVEMRSKVQSFDVKYRMPQWDD